MPPAGKTWITVDVELLLGLSKLDDSDLDRGGQAAAYLALIAHSRVRQTDGFIREKDASRVIAIATGDDQVKSDDRLGDLVLTGLVRRDRHGYRVPDYAEWQQTREAISALTERQREKGRASGQARKERAAGSTTGSPAVQPKPNRGSTEESRGEERYTETVVEARTERASASTVPESTNGHQLDGQLAKILDASISQQLTTAQVNLVNRAWTTSSTELRQSLADVEKADKPVAMLCSIAARLAPSLDDHQASQAGQVERRQRAVRRCVELYRQTIDDGDSEERTIAWLRNEYRHDPSIVDDALASIPAETPDPELDPDDAPI